MTLPPFKLERYFAQYEFNVEYLLCSSDCEAMTVADLLDFEPGAEKKLGAVWLGYTESLGSPALRSEISKIYSSISPDEILVHTGAGEAIYLFMHSMLTAEDHVVVHTPSYQSLSEVARGIGCEVSPWIAREENGWALDFDELRQLLRPNTRAVVVNTPHNPTGYLMPRADFLALNHLAQEHDLLLFSDEVYRESEYDPSERLPAACDLGPHGISLGVTSKTYGLAGLRIGWIATKNRKVFESMAVLKDYTTICNSAPAEFLAELAMRHRTRLATRNLEIIRSNVRVVDELFDQHRDMFSWVRPRAGSMGFPKLRKGDIDVFCDLLVKHAGVLLLPGSMYEDHGNHFRIGLGRKNLPQAVKRLQGYLQKLPSSA